MRHDDRRCPAPPPLASSSSALQNPGYVSDSGDRYYIFFFLLGIVNFFRVPTVAGCTSLLEREMRSPSANRCRGVSQTLLLLTPVKRRKTAVSKSVETPLMKQYFSIKAKHPDAILLFRVGDFYEMYGQDAVEGAEILGIVQTKRSNGAAQDVEMAGFPFHALDAYLPKLVRAGRRVAVCDQLEDPKLAKKLVKRGITELVTPGVAMDDHVLERRENNFLAAVHFGKAACGVAFLDISTGEFLTAQGSTEEVDKWLTDFAPKEVLICRGLRDRCGCTVGPVGSVFELEAWVFNAATARERLLRHFETAGLTGFGVEDLEEGIVAAGAILVYLDRTKHTQIAHITTLTRIEEDQYVRLDKFTVHNLELVRTMSEGGRSLLQTIDETTSPMGARMMKRWVLFPLKDGAEIRRRQSTVATLVREPALREALIEQLGEMGDVERVISKVAVGRVTPREVVQLRRALEAIGQMRDCCVKSGDAVLQAWAEELDPCTEVSERIGREIVSEPPAVVGKGGIIARGVSAELDELREIAYSGKDYLTKLQQRESQRTGIPSLKVAFNNVFGYYIEVRNTHKDKVPPEWIRKQTLVSAERYITEELKEYEEKILGAEERILALESELFNRLTTDLTRFIRPIQHDAQVAARLDCIASFARTASIRRYVQPVVDDSDVIDIKGGRHPVIEQQLPSDEPYVANDVHLDRLEQQILIITGPNMAGKSALLRQTALIALMAQIGSYVPAESARIGWVDKIFTRVGASDNISAGESTFMVEMNEAANILNNVTPRSLVLFDELGRGTSTYDGISIAWAIVEYIHEHPRAAARTLFATHYHELNEMARTFPRIRNFNISVRESGNRVIFLRKLVPGGSAHSFGIHVARMAGMPRRIVERAEEILHQLEEDHARGVEDASVYASRSGAGSGKGDGAYQLSFFQLDDPVLCQVRDEIRHIDVNNLTPLEALNKLSEIKRIIQVK